MEWETVIGLEIHCQLATDSKIFSGSSTEFGAEPNSQASAVDIALPGVLPVMNMDAARMAVKFGLAVNATVNERSVFARKNYFYPDLPKGYQISQFEEPIVSDGRISITVEDKEKVIGITRAHLEEDAGKSLHEGFTDVTGIDLNRAGVPLIEIVSEPDMRSPEEAVAYMRKIHALVRYLEISDGNMQEGSFRCDANISVRPKGDKKLGTRTEIKNINSFRFVDRAIRYEVERQIDIIEDGGEVAQETRLYDPNADETRSMRSKEEAHDYRYFPDPDLPPMVLSPELIEEIRATLPELPEAKRNRFMEEYSLDEKDAGALTATREIAAYFEKAAEAANGEAKMVANWVNGDVASYLNRNNVEIDDSPVSPKALGGLVQRIADKTISNKIGKTVFEEMWKTGSSADDVIENQGLKQITDTGAIEQLVDDVLGEHTEQAQQFRDGNEKVFGFLVGKVMQASKGKANPGQVNELLKAKLTA